MKQIVEILRELEEEIAAEKGGFALFALLEREDRQDEWDLLVSASWFGEDKKAILRFIVSRIESRFTPDDMIKFSRVVLLDPENTFVRAINSTIETEHRTTEFTNCSFGGILIKHAYILASRRSG